MIFFLLQVSFQVPWSHSSCVSPPKHTQICISFIKVQLYQNCTYIQKPTPDHSHIMYKQVDRRKKNSKSTRRNSHACARYKKKQKSRIISRRAYLVSPLVYHYGVNPWRHNFTHTMAKTTLSRYAAEFLAYVYEHARTRGGEQPSINVTSLSPFLCLSLSSRNAWIMFICVVYL